MHPTIYILYKAVKESIMLMMMMMMNDVDVDDDDDDDNDHRLQGDDYR